MWAGIVNKKLGHKTLMYISTVLFGAGFWMSSLVKMPWQLNISYGVLVGVAAGIGYNILTCTVNSWFEGRIGMSSGMLFMGFGSGSFLFAGLIHTLEKHQGWDGTFRTLAVFMSVSILAIAAVLKKKEELRSDAAKCADDPKMSVSVLQTGMTTAQMMKTRAFYTYYIWTILVWAIGLAIIGNSAVMITEVGGTGLAVLAAGIVSVVNGISRVIMGNLYDQKGSAFVIRTVSAAMLLSMALFQIAFRCHILSAAIVALFAGAVGCGGVAPTNSAFVREYFGSRCYAANFGVFGTFAIFASIAGSFLVGKLVAYSGGYGIATVPLLFYASVAFVEQRFIPKKPLL